MKAKIEKKLIARFQERLILCDLESFELSTGKEKHKCKICGSAVHLLGQFPFYVMTTQDTYDKRTRVEINEKHCGAFDAEYMNDWPAFACPTRVELLTKDEYLSKCESQKNGLPNAGSLEEAKYQELRANANKVLRSGISKDRKRIAIQIVHGEQVAENMIRNLVT